MKIVKLSNWWIGMYELVAGLLKYTLPKEFAGYFMLKEAKDARWVAVV